MTRQEFVRFIATNVPNVGKRTAERLYDSGVNSLDTLDQYTVDDICAQGIGRFKAVSIKAFSDARLRLYRFTKGFDSILDPSDIWWLVLLVAAVIFTLLMPVFGLMQASGYFQLGLWALTLLFSGLYWCYVFIQKRKAERLFLVAGVLFLMILLHRIIYSFLISIHADQFNTVGALAFIVFLVTYAHYSLFKYRSLINIRTVSVEVFANGVIGISALLLLKLIRSLFVFLRDQVQLHPWETAGLLLGILAGAFFLSIARAISQRRHFPSRQILIGLYLFFFGFLLLWGVDSIVVGLDLSSIISQVCADFIVLAIPALCLWCYILYPRKFFPNLGRIFLTAIILVNLFRLVYELGLARLLLGNLGEPTIWVLLRRLADIFLILTFFGFSGGVARVLQRIVKHKKTTTRASFSDVREAADECLAWTDIGRYEDYFDVSNLCFQHGYFDLGIEYLHRGLGERTYPYYGKGVLQYQLACGHALAGRREQALSHLNEALYLFPRMKKHALHDEMLSSVAQEINSC